MFSLLIFVTVLSLSFSSLLVSVSSFLTSFVRSLSQHSSLCPLDSPQLPLLSFVCYEFSMITLFEQLIQFQLFFNLSYCVYLDNLIIISFYQKIYHKKEQNLFNLYSLLVTIKTPLTTFLSLSQMKKKIFIIKIALTLNYCMMGI